MKKFLLLSMSISLTFFAFSQTTRKIEARSLQREELIKEDQPSATFQMALKTDVASIILGDVPIISELKLGYNFSIEPGIFLTCNDLEGQIRSNDYTIEHVKTNLTLGYQIGLRYYFDEVFDAKSFFAELNYRYKSLTRTYTDSYPEANGAEIEDKVNRLGMRFGNQWVFLNNLVFDFSLGVAYQFGSSSRFIEDLTIPGSGKVYDVDDQFAPAALMIGARFGYVFR